MRRSTNGIRAVVAIVLVGAVILTVAATAAAHQGGDEDEAFRVRFIHAVPDLVVDVELGPDLRYRGIGHGVELFLGSAAGTSLTVTVRSTDTDDVVLDTTVSVPADRAHTFLLHRTADGAVELAAIDNSIGPVPPGAGRLTIHHQGHGPAVDAIVAAAGDSTPDQSVGLMDITPGEDNGIDLPPGPIKVSLRYHDGSAAAPVTVDIEPEDETVIYLTGSPAAGDASVVTSVVHGLDVDPEASTPVELWSAVTRPEPDPGPLWIRLVTVAAAVTAIVGFGSLAARRQRVRPPATTGAEPIRR